MRQIKLWLRRKLLAWLERGSRVKDFRRGQRVETTEQFVYGDDEVDPCRSDHGKAVDVEIVIKKLMPETDSRAY